MPLCDTLELRRLHRAQTLLSLGKPRGEGLSPIMPTRPLLAPPGEGSEEIAKVTFQELRQQVALFAAAMRKMGVKKGDRVVGECRGVAGGECGTCGVGLGPSPEPHACCLECTCVYVCL